MAQENADMPDFGALANLHGTIANMGKMRKVKQMNDLAAKLGVEVQAGEENLSAEELTSVLMQRAKEAGKTEEEINAAVEG
jgi:alkylhydroperoxidase/carboxymuconolactone decarboxylase family protein YurZ